MARRTIMFKELGQYTINLVGGKALNLGKLYQNFKVPNGFVITTDVYSEFLIKTQLDLKIKHLLNEITDFSNLSLVQQKANEIQKLIVTLPMPDEIKEDILAAYHVLSSGGINPDDLLNPKESFVSVRSSAPKEDSKEGSIAGQHATYLNVKGGGTIIKAVKSCWASLFLAKSLVHRNLNNESLENMGLAIIVQTMVNSDKSGVILTKNVNVSDGDNELIIEAVFGLGESLVREEVNFDYYLLDKETLLVKENKVGLKPFELQLAIGGGVEKRKLLPDKQQAPVLDHITAQSLTQTAKKIESFFGTSQDIEWAIENDEIYILQSRPINLSEKPVEVTEPVESIMLENDNLVEPVLIESEHIEPILIEDEPVEPILIESDSVEPVLIEDQPVEPVMLGSVEIKEEIEYFEPTLIETEPVSEKIEFLEKKEIEYDNCEVSEDISSPSLFEPIGDSIQKVIFPGIAVGKLTIVNDVADLSNVLEGDIVLFNNYKKDMFGVVKRSRAVVLNGFNNSELEQYLVEQQKPSMIIDASNCSLVDSSIVTLNSNELKLSCVQ
ncbi:hypothetical protein HN587_01050 [Candidatus Woesearchaeota archaeon]|jgi:phosphoenolpyruvate synthase/pyruvate phosphate dikinase|nr:hypothetical protein [Candidatus Woesearchaeota archaeon]